MSKSPPIVTLSNIVIDDLLQLLLKIKDEGYSLVDITVNPGRRRVVIAARDSPTERDESLNDDIIYKLI